jgi:hypothetical protein
MYSVDYQMQITVCWMPVNDDELDWPARPQGRERTAVTSPSFVQLTSNAKATWQNLCKHFFRLGVRLEKCLHCRHAAEAHSAPSASRLAAAVTAAHDAVGRTCVGASWSVCQ